MIIGIAIFNVKRGSEAEGEEGIKDHLEFAKQHEGFIEGKVLRSKTIQGQYMLYMEFENEEHYFSMGDKLKEESAQNPAEFQKFFALMSKEPTFGTFEVI